MQQTARIAYYENVTQSSKHWPTVELTLKCTPEHQTLKV